MQGLTPTGPLFALLAIMKAGHTHVSLASPTMRPSVLRRDTSAVRRQQHPIAMQLAERLGGLSDAGALRSRCQMFDTLNESRFPSSYAIAPQIRDHPRVSPVARVREA